MAIGYCSKCQTTLIAGKWAMINRKKYCLKCAGENEEAQAVSKENDAIKRNFFQYLLSLFPTLSIVPEHWYSTLEAMIRRGWSVKNIQNTIVYCGQQGKIITEDNWSQLVYVYYAETVQWIEHLKEIQAKNGEVDLTPKTVNVPFRSTTYRDMPSYSIEDL